MTKCLKKINERCFKVENDKDKLWNETKKVKEIKKLILTVTRKTVGKSSKANFYYPFYKNAYRPD